MYRLLTPVSQGEDERIVILFDVDVQEIRSWKILPTFDAAIHVCLQVVVFIVLVVCKGQRFSMRR
jgi:hypothetical protein